MATKTDDAVTATAERLATMMEADGAAWIKPWQDVGGGRLLAPINATTEATYRGYNVIATAIASLDHGYTSGTWATFRQWQSIGAQVRKGERSTVCVKWVAKKKRDDDRQPGETTMDDLAPRLIPCTFRLFAAEQVDGWEAPGTQEQLWADDAIADAYLAAVPSEVVDGGSIAAFSPTTDRVLMPERGQFPDAARYYSTAFHEHVHWTGPRLGRKMSDRFGSDGYALEELVAELGAATLCARFGYSAETDAQHAAYLRHWVKILREQPRCLLTVAAKASDAVEHLDTYQVRQLAAA